MRLSRLALESVPRGLQMKVILIRGLVLAALLKCGVLTTATAVQAQRPETNAVDADVLEDNQIRPAFRAEPIVHRLEARRGEVIPFEFKLHSSGRPTRLLIVPIAITQRENGVIASDSSVAAPAAIRLEGDTEIDFDTGEDYIIRGQVRVPTVQSTFHSFGILVRDLGLPSDTVNPAADDQVRFGVRFVTQYLLRCDIKVLGARAEKVDQVQIESLRIAPESGLAKLQTWIVNPTDSPMSLEVTAQLRNTQTGQQFPRFNLAMPIRAHLEDEEKRDVRILPKTRLRLEELIPHPLLPGPWEVYFQVLDGRRVGTTASLPVEFDVTDFPAQNRQLIALPNGVVADPGFVELSVQRGGKRFAPVSFINYTDQDVTFELQFTPLGDASAAEFLDVRPTSLTLRPGASRNALLLLRQGSDLQSAVYGHLHLRQVDADTSKTQRVTVGLIARQEDQPELTFGEMVWDTDRQTPALVLPITNIGRKHLPLDATLTVTAADGASQTVPAGFGRWLLPGGSDQLRFRFETIPPPGQYQLTLRIDMGPDQPPLESQNTIQFQERDDATSD